MRFGLNTEATTMTDNDEMINCLIGDVLADHAIARLTELTDTAVRVSRAQLMIDKLTALMTGAQRIAK